jgi:hypothetical protein
MCAVYADAAEPIGRVRVSGGTSKPVSPHLSVLNLSGMCAPCLGAPGPGGTRLVLGTCLSRNPRHVASATCLEHPDGRLRSICSCTSVSAHRSEAAFNSAPLGVMRPLCRRGGDRPTAASRPPSLTTAPLTLDSPSAQKRAPNVSPPAAGSLQGVERVSWARTLQAARQLVHTLRRAAHPAGAPHIPARCPAC